MTSRCEWPRGREDTMKCNAPAPSRRRLPPPDGVNEPANEEHHHEQPEHAEHPDQPRRPCLAPEPLERARAVLTLGLCARGARTDVALGLFRGDSALRTQYFSQPAVVVGAVVDGQECRASAQ